MAKAVSESEILREIAKRTKKTFREVKEIQEAHKAAVVKSLKSGRPVRTIFGRIKENPGGKKREIAGKTYITKRKLRISVASWLKQAIGI